MVILMTLFPSGTLFFILAFYFLLAPFNLTLSYSIDRTYTLEYSFQPVYHKWVIDILNGQNFDVYYLLAQENILNDYAINIIIFQMCYVIKYWKLLL